MNLLIKSGAENEPTFYLSQLCHDAQDELSRCGEYLFTELETIGKSVSMMNKNNWSVPHQNQTPKLLNDEIHVWRAFLEVPSARLKYLHRILSDDEVNRAVRYCFERDRRRFIIRRGLLRCILGLYLDQSPRSLAFQCNNYGKPALASISGEPSLCFNVSHSGGLTLYAITRKREVGIDIEYVRPLEDAEDIVKHFFSSREKAEFGSLPAQIKNQAFFACWTRKEAYIKAMGEGFSYPLINFSVSMIPDEPAGLVEIKDDKNKKSRWFLKTILPGAGYVAAVAVEGHGLAIRHRQWLW